MDQGRPVHTPVLLYPVEVDADGQFLQFRLDHSRVSLNPALGAIFDLPSDFENQILDLIPNGEFNLATPELIAKRLASHIHALDVRLIDGFPDLLTPSQISAYPDGPKPVLLPASALLLADKSKNVAGLLHELERLRDESPETLPFALLEILGLDSGSTPSASQAPVRDSAPAFLNPSQQQLLRSAVVNPLTVCHGPPGTGKSFTVAATALDHVMRSQSVLIACRSDEAAAIIEEKIAELMPDAKLVVRAGRRKHLGELKARLDQLLGNHGDLLDEPSRPATRANHLERQLAAAHSHVRKRIEAETANGWLFENPPQSLLDRFRLWKHRFKVSRSLLLLQLLRNLELLHRQRLGVVRQVNAETHKACLRKHLGSLRGRSVLKRYREAIGRRAPASQERELLELDLKALLKFLPIWITTTDDIHRVLPFKRGVFDLVIIDEATQIDLASALPILYRGQRALITGDPRQLRHLSFLSNHRLQALTEKHRLSPEAAADFDFRRRSFLDRAIQVTSGTGALTFLDEHFRSLPELISFSNQHFYQGNIHCMREVETLALPENFSPFTNHRINGRRSPNGVNHAEIDAAVAVLQEILTTSAADTAPPESLGFLSPFRAQVDAFHARIQSDFSAPQQQRLLRDHQLIAGTAHSFQGAERDTMLISFAIGPNNPSAARRFLERADVFNVAVTRARQHIHLFHSIDSSDLPLDSLLAAYLRHAAGGSIVSARRAVSKTFDPPHDLLPSLTAAGWEIAATATTIAGLPIDILLRRGARHLALDLIGSSCECGAAVSIAKSLLLQRAGLTLIPLSIAEWVVRKESVMESLTHHSGPG